MAGWWWCARCGPMMRRGSRRCGGAWMLRPGAGSPIWLICRPTAPATWPCRGRATRRGSSRPLRPGRLGRWRAWRGMSARPGTPPGSWCSSTPSGGAPGWAPCCCAGLAEAARHAGVRRLGGDVLRGDAAILGLLEELGLEYQEQVTAATVHASFAVQETDAYLDAVLADQRAAARVAVGPFLRPGSIALVGASDKPGSVGGLLLANLLASGFTGPVYPVNPRHQVIQGMICYPDLPSCPGPPDLALVAVPAPVVAGVVGQAGALGVRAVCVISAGCCRTSCAAVPGPQGSGSSGRTCMGLLSAGPIPGSTRLSARSSRRRPAGVRDPIRRARAGRADPAAPALGGRQRLCVGRRHCRPDAQRLAAVLG